MIQLIIDLHQLELLVNIILWVLLAGKTRNDILLTKIYKNGSV